MCEQEKYSGHSEKKLYKSKDLVSDSGELLKTKKFGQKISIEVSPNLGPNRSAKASRVDKCHRMGQTEPRACNQRMDTNGTENKKQQG